MSTPPPPSVPFLDQSSWPIAPPPSILGSVSQIGLGVVSPLLLACLYRIKREAIPWHGTAQGPDHFLLCRLCFRAVWVQRFHQVPGTDYGKFLAPLGLLTTGASGHSPSNLCGRGGKGHKHTVHLRRLRGNVFYTSIFTQGLYVCLLERR